VAVRSCKRPNDARSAICWWGSRYRRGASPLHPNRKPRRTCRTPCTACTPRCTWRDLRRV
jgi:hypothetical protein